MYVCMCVWQVYRDGVPGLGPTPHHPEQAGLI